MAKKAKMPTARTLTNVTWKRCAALVIMVAASVAVFCFLFLPVEGRPGSAEASPTVVCGSPAVGLVANPARNLGGAFVAYCDGLRQSRLWWAGGIFLGEIVLVYALLSPSVHRVRYRSTAN